MLIIVPSVISAIGIVFIVVAVAVDQTIVRAVFLSVGLLLIWIDTFLTMAVIRRSLRDIDLRLRRIESRLDREP